jgi:hypothetical protein
MYSKIDISERELEDLVRRFADKIEAGMVYLTHQNRTPTGRLDVLLVDSGKSLVGSELKVVEDDAMLMQCLDYYDHVASGVETYARLHPNHEIDPSQPVRMVLIAPSFSQTLVNRCKWIDASISLFTYTCLKLDKSAELLPVFMEQSLPSTLEQPVVHKQEDRLNYITDPAAKARAVAFIDKVKAKWQGRTAVDAIEFAISLKVDGKVVGYIEPRRKHFILSTYNTEDKWTPHNIQSEDDLAPVFKLMEQCVDRRTR